MRRPARSFLGVGASVTLVFLMAPILVVIFSAFDDGKFFRFPPRELSLRWFEAAFASAEYRRSLLNSAIVATTATLISTAIGLMAAVGITRGDLRARPAIEILLLAPLTLPLVVWGIGLLQVYARLGVSGSIGGLILAHAVITLPLSVRILIATLSQIDPNLELAARSLGARPMRAFARTTLRLALPGVFTAGALSFIVSFNEVIVSTFIAGAGWITFPVRMYSQLRGQGVDPITLAIGAMIVAAIFIVVAIGEATFRWSRRL
jgi:putative spermidine/putrescine transport system permease protein